MEEPKYRIEFDDEADGAYVRNRRRINCAYTEVADGILMDFDSRDEMLGVEVLDIHGRVGARDKVSYLNGLVAGRRVRPRTAAVE